METRHGTEGKEKAHVLEEFGQRRKERDAPLEEGEGEERTRRQGRQSEEPKAGDRNRPFEGP